MTHRREVYVTIWRRGVAARFGTATGDLPHYTQMTVVSNGLITMANGKPGDHPLSDIVQYGKDVYSKKASALIQEIMA